MEKTAEYKDLFQSADWTKEKHVPVIEVQPRVKKGEPFQITVMIGKQIPHPNTTEHHIEWIDVAFLPDDEKFPYQIGRISFSAHGASAQGPNTSTVFTHHQGVLVAKTDKPGTIFASSSCNIHGLWQSVDNKHIDIE